MVCLPRDETARAGRVIQVGQEVTQQEQVVLPSDLCDHFIDRMDYHFIMDFCICRRSKECEDYPTEYGCIFMGEPARGINPKWGHEATKEEAKAHIRTCQEAGLIHFIGKSKLDTVWLGVGPGHKLFTICNCCPCCCINRGVAYFPENITRHLQRAPGVRVTVTDECTACGECTEDVCFAHAIELTGDRAVITDRCRGCGRCADHCAQDAIRLEIDTDRFLTETYARLSEVIDLPPP
jgi:ferredoxin